MHVFRSPDVQGNDGNLDSVSYCDVITTSDVSGLSSSYFRLVKKILIKATGQFDAARSGIRGEESLGSKAGKRDGDFASPRSTTLMDLFAQCAMKMNAKDSIHGKQRDEFDIALAFNAFLDHLRLCEDEATALELIEILAILSSKEPELAHRTLEACWRVLHTVYTISHRHAIKSKGDDLPLTFQVALDPQNRCQLVNRVLVATIGKTAKSDAKNVQNNVMLRFGVLLLWSLTTQPPCTTFHYGFNYLSKLTDELQEFIDGIDGAATSSLTIKGDDKSSQQETERSQRLERRATRNRPHATSIPSLTLGSFDALFELLLHGAVASFAISPHARTAVQTNDTSADKSPFQHHYDILELINRLLDVYISQFHLFPRRMLSIVLGSCKHMLSVCIFQVDGCVQWRNAQPILSVQEKRAGVHDYGSIKFLEQLLQKFVTWGAGKVMTVCQKIRQLSCPSADSDGDEEEELLAILPQNDKRFTSLMTVAQKTMDTLRDVASAHNLVAPQFDTASLEKLPKEQATKRSFTIDATDKGYHELDKKESFQMENDEDGPIGKQKKRRRVTPTLVTVQTDGDHRVTADSAKSRKRRHPVIEEEDDTHGRDQPPTMEDNASQRSSDGFGVSGKWGGDDDEDADEESSSASLELEVSNIFQAA